MSSGPLIGAIIVPGCMSEQITEEDFNVGLYTNKNDIEPRFVGTVMEIDVSNVVSISNVIKACQLSDRYNE